MIEKKKKGKSRAKTPAQQRAIKKWQQAGSTAAKRANKGRKKSS